MDKYNGWTNYATWRVNLELFDGFNPYDAGYSKEHDAYTLGQCLEEYAKDVLDAYADSEGLAHSYAMAFISEVNWREIAQHMIDAHSEEAA